MRIRAVAILIENEKIALIERYRAGKHFFAFPGGGVDEGETVEQAVVREMEEETGLRVTVLRKVAEVWFRGNRQEFFLVDRLDGEFGTGTGEEFQNIVSHDHHIGTYHPLWLPVSELSTQPVLPKEMAERIVRYLKEGWPPEIFVISETSS